MLSLIFCISLLWSQVDAQNIMERARRRRRPARATAMYNEMCLGANRNPSHTPCMCDFLRTVEEGIFDMPSYRGAEIPCINSTIDTGDYKYPCQNVVLLSMVGLIELLQGGDNEEGSDCWGWTASTGEEIAMIGLESMVGFVDITDPVNPIYLGRLPARGNRSYWRDIKVYGDYAFIVSENNDHGMQVIEMTQMVGLDVSQGPVTFAETVHYAGFTTAHNIFIHEETGYAYVVGSNMCQSGLYIVDIKNPLSPTFEACFSEDGYVHDVQCVIYNGADTRYTGREICFACNTDTVTIIDVTDKSNMVMLSRTTYVNVAYTHQGWLTEDHNTFFFGDENDEMNHNTKTRTMVLNVKNLQKPIVVGAYTGATSAIDHNLYVLGKYIYEGNYANGLEVLRMGDSIDRKVDLKQVAQFDSYPEGKASTFNGAWSVYPYFASGNIIISDINRGLIVVRVDTEGDDPPIEAVLSCYKPEASCGLLDRRKGFFMNRPSFTGLFCRRRCVPEDDIERRLSAGWKCGRCRN
ncbi:hypothetical protein FisN_17Hh188 [Fistulifera solaris]|uniref:Choice-of-anchor B domain-containing protein n=1 Tax=Fistulifera solaris TaxID=1519565 RepID=A0A1Z5JHL3_FISSO|nr:hypothetical protein FisN_17Hh188 [Fistulifera solaris]|eukprot:GAX13251.1 hypothetical protein FisN_17Hh188 [Fistulifera solaris]